MRTFLALVTAALFSCASLRADFSYWSRVQVSGSDPIATSRVIKGRRMAILSKGHTSVIDLDAETITEIDFPKKTYSVVPFSKWKKVLDDAAAHSPRETSFKVAIHAGASAASTKPIGILNAAESVINIAGVSGALQITVNTWVGVVPGYEQMRDFVDKLAEKLGYTFAAGLAVPALRVPDCLPGLDEAIKRMNESRGAPIETGIKIASHDKTIAEASIQLGKFAGGAQLAATFTPPEGFKKVDATFP